MTEHTKELESLKGAASNAQQERQKEYDGRVKAEKEAALATYQLDTQRRFVDEIDGLSKHAESIRESLQDMKLELDDKERLNIKQQDKLLSLTTTNDSLQTTQEDLIRKVNAADQRVDSVNVEKDYLADIIVEKQEMYSTLDNEKQEVEDKYRSSITQNAYLTAVRARLDEELLMERERSKTLADSLLEKQDYLEVALSKPRYVSEASIARNEGFKMPLGSMSLNSRKNYLGTGKPTLLKFQKKESTNDNTE